MLEHAVPVTTQDVVLIFVTVSGTHNGRLVQEKVMLSWVKKIFEAVSKLPNADILANQAKMIDLLAGIDDKLYQLIKIMGPDPTADVVGIAVEQTGTSPH